ncbi:FxLD family lanthipeptide [Nocardiopsis metallicus]|uniref:FxLD family lantipeptide n=1 Tax=Nocardiopsis metallicus TaxID=179819 RepID=A0A840W3G8_9ACTN|nr:FxLD family lanthipeptide [Nocardiopsis metallicus]MBB5491440.1 FxLD family lantipeptide [Nocardiopsis metallicus]
MSENQLDADGFDLDVEVVESGPRLDSLLNLTGDNCGSTCESACSTSCS